MYRTARAAAACRARLDRPIPSQGESGAGDRGLCTRRANRRRRRTSKRHPGSSPTRRRLKASASRFRHRRISKGGSRLGGQSGHASRSVREAQETRFRHICSPLLRVPRPRHSAGFRRSRGRGRSERASGSRRARPRPSRHPGRPKFLPSRAQKRFRERRDPAHGDLGEDVGRRLSSAENRNDPDISTGACAPRDSRRAVTIRCQESRPSVPREHSGG